jgi:hypothetical protein
MTDAPLAEVAVVMEPHAELLQLILQLTPALVPSLLTTAEMLDVAPVASEVGGAAPKEIEIAAGGFGVEPPPLQAVKAMTASVESNEARWRVLTGFLHFLKSGSSHADASYGERGNHYCYELRFAALRRPTGGRRSSSAHGR